MAQATGTGRPRDVFRAYDLGREKGQEQNGSHDVERALESFKQSDAWTEVLDELRVMAGLDETWFALGEVDTGEAYHRLADYTAAFNRGFRHAVADRERNPPSY